MGPFASLASTTLDADRYGAKASVLALLHKAGVTVPMGFALPWDSLPLSSSDVCALADHLKMLASDRVIVRSSALVEDRAAASHAGLFETIANVDKSDTQSVMLAVNRVCNPGPRRLEITRYHEALGSTASTRVAVIVQEQIEPVTGGVLFTSPSFAPRVAVSIEASAYGPAAVVAGKPGTHRANIREPTSSDSLRQAALHLLLPDAALRTLVSMSRECQNVLHVKSADIEWVWNGIAVYILQARPAV